MSCRYKNLCPSYSGWCESPKQDFSTCILFLITAYEHTKEELEDCRKELREYKNTGLTPEQLWEMDREYRVLSKEVMELRKGENCNLKERLETFYNKPIDEIHVEDTPEEW